MNPSLIEIRGALKIIDRRIKAYNTKDYAIKLWEQKSKSALLKLQATKSYFLFELKKNYPKAYAERLRAEERWSKIKQIKRNERFEEWMTEQKQHLGC